MDKKNNVIYVGQTTNMDTRMNGHLYSSKNNSSDLYENLHWIEYAEIKSDYHMNIYEIHYICKYKPKFNIQYASENIDLFNLPEIEWKPYITNGYIRNFQMVHDIKNGVYMTPKEINEKLDSDKDFYNQLMEMYRNSNFIHRQFNTHEYECY